MTSDGAEFSPVRGAGGQFLDILEVADAVAPRYDGLYVTDLDGRRHGEPQLDYLQELARDADVWLDAGVRVADEAIDGLVTGARRVILSTASLTSARELRRAWKMSTELVFELVVSPEGTVLAMEGEWGGHSPEEVATAARTVGVDTLLYTPRGHAPNWSLVRLLAAGGAVWVGGGYRPIELPSLADSGAAGAIYQLPTDLLDKSAAPDPGPAP
jgi:hypothetical protein